MRFSDYERIVFFTGAGLSAESGIPTYRGKGGMWSEYDYEDYACERAFRRDPEKVWDFHDKRRAAVFACEPNDGHRIIAEVQRERPGTVVITQNIDGLHQRSGATDVIELHGSLWRVRCDREHVVRDDASVPMSPRKCSCGAYWRPDIVWFEDSLDQRNLRRAHELLESCDLVVSIGTSGVVYPAADLPRIAMRSGATSVEINLDETPVSALYQHRLRGKASEMLASMR
ncbi:MAG: NAD-dependent protein deacetylase of family [Labilithrix sp.]|nr:NAD-dependent protein deacetylase of family [Labilithrix sp.]